VTFLGHNVLAHRRGAVRDIAAIILLFSGLALFWGAAAEAHSSRNGTDKTSGISIANLTHGQLHVLTRYQTEILRLADRQIQPSVEARTLQNFVNLQFAYCLWGLVPGSLSDEANPFNECSHAYLAGAKALLDHLRQTEDTRVRADALAARINLAMLADATALEICSNSFEPFNSAQIIMPTWRDAPFNPLGILLGFFVLSAAVLWLALSWNRRPPPQRA
jgi:hypothetical protein